MANRNWMTGKDYCKTTGSYPFGNLPLSNITKACIESTNIEAVPHWIGVVKETYQTQDHGNGWVFFSQLYL